jgi:hypothetical protein
MNMLLGKISAKVGKIHIFRPTTVNYSLHEISNNGVIVVNFATSKQLTFKGTKFSHCNVHKFTWTSTDGTRAKLTILDRDSFQVYLKSSHSG